MQETLCIVACILIAKQRLAKHIPLEASAGIEVHC
jgi:hypothetical protein